MDDILGLLFKIVFGYPGAFVLWMMEGRKKKIEAYFEIEEYGGVAYFLGIVLFAIAFFMVLLSTQN